MHYICIIHNVQFLGCTGKWSDQHERRKWEEKFSEIVIDPVTADIEKTLRNTYALSMKGTYFDNN